MQQVILRRIVGGSAMGLQDAILVRTSNTLKYKDDKVTMLDRRRYPEEEVWQTYSSYEEVAAAIEEMVIQGAGSVAFAAGLGLALAARTFDYLPHPEFDRSIEIAGERLKRTRPTGEYLIPLVDKLVSICVKARAKNMDPATAIVKEVERLMEEDDLITRRCGYFAATLIDDGDGILTHCYPGGALIYMLDEVGNQGKEVAVYCSETRPYLQGARLTAQSVSKLGVETKIITDNMGALLMWQGKIQKLITACDRITMNGHIANKIGTYQYAICAGYHRIPFIVLGYDGPQVFTPDASGITIEERDPDEVLYCRGVRTGAPGVGGYYPAFDITPPTLISAIVTDRGVFSPLALRAAYSDRFPVESD